MRSGARAAGRIRKVVFSLYGFSTLFPSVDIICLLFNPGSRWIMNINTDHSKPFPSFYLVPSTSYANKWTRRFIRLLCLIISLLMSEPKGQEKWSSVRITDAKKNSMKVENHVSIHSNLNLNGLCPASDQIGGIGKEVNKLPAITWLNFFEVVAKVIKRRWKNIRKNC